MREADDAATTLAPELEERIKTTIEDRDKNAGWKIVKIDTGGFGSYIFLSIEEGATDNAIHRLK